MPLESLGTDINGRVDFSLDQPVQCFDVPLPATTVVSATTPPNFNRAFFAYGIGTNVWVTMDGTTPVVPVAPATTTQELLPSIRKISLVGGQTLKFISDTASYVNIRWDANQDHSAN